MQVPDIDDAMAQAVDIGENDVSIVLGEYIDILLFLFVDVSMLWDISEPFMTQDEEEDAEEAEKDEKVARNWSVLKSTPELRNSKVKRHIHTLLPSICI